MSLHASRITLRPFADDDVSMLHQLYQDEELARIVPQPIHADLATSKALLTRIRERHATGATIGWVIALRESGKPIGTCGLVRIDRDVAKADVAYQLLREHWGNGLGRESVETMVRFAFDDLRLVRLVARIDALNVRSQRFAERLGFVAKETFEEVLDGSTRTTHVFQRAAPYVVRRVVPDDVARLRNVRLAALESDPLAFGSTLAREVALPQSEWERWAREHASGSEAATFLARACDDAIGIVSVKREHADTFHVFSMWVQPRARRIGVAGNLIAEVTRWASASGAKRLSLWVTQPGAQAMYERCGFVDDEHRQPLVHTPSVIERGMIRSL
jgi:RimJ/RimL family protein N-acetyltransferase